MTAFYKGRLLFLLVTAGILLLSIPAVIFILNKANLPVTVYSSGKSILVKSIHNTNLGLLKNDEIKAIDGIPIYSREEIELIMDSKDVGTFVILDVQRGSELFKIPVKADNFYSLSFVILQIFTFLVFILLGAFVIIKCSGSKPAEIFYMAMLGAATIMIMTWGKYSSSFDLSYIIRFIFHTAYIFTPVIFVYFSLSFPRERSAEYRRFVGVLVLIGIILLILINIWFYKTATNLNSQNISAYISVYNLVRYFITASVVISITIFFLNYLKARDQVERKKLKWLIMGFIVGPLSFIILWVLPQAFTDYAFIPEEIVYLLMLSVPVTFAISIVKYHLMDIDFLINRSLVYSFSVAIIILVYLALVLLISSLIEEINVTVLSSISAVLVAFLFNPLKNYLRHFVDRKFFKVQYDFRQAVKNVFSEMKEINDVTSLSEKVVAGIYNLIPVEKIALVDVSDKMSPKLLAKFNFSDQDFSFIKNEVVAWHDLQNNISLQDKTEPGIDFEKKDSLKEHQLSIILTAGQAFKEAQIILAAGDKKSGYKYSAEDTDLLLNILYSAASLISRIRVQEDLLRKNLEAEKLVELNKQKSLFVSSVSHDLKTPLAAIRIYSELINMNSDTGKVDHYTKYIIEESERLKRLIDNVLSFSSIEKGIKVYHKEPADLNEILKRSLDIMEHQIKLSGFEIVADISSQEMLILADADAILEVFINLINNAIKYSGQSRIIKVSTSEENGSYYFCIQDYGIGISDEDQEKLFSPFYRTSQAQSLKIDGTGLGLTIIKHIADAHNIEVSVKSKLSEGTIFSLKFPMNRGENIYEEHFIN